MGTGNPTGNGVTLAAVGQSPFVGRVQKLGGWNRSVEVLEDSGLDTTDYEEYCFAELIKHGAIRVEVLTDGTAESLPALGQQQAWSITFKSGRALTGTGAISESVSSELENNVRRRETFDLQFDGKTGPTLSS